MRILISIDDTDNLESRGTGDLATDISREIETRGWGVCSFITRHQLLVHPDIPYTSHNSSMCFSAEIEESALDDIIRYAAGFLARESADGSDPGLCIAVVDRLSDPESLIAFGRRAKQSVIAMGEAYRLARQMGIHLSEHGGSGQGVIGALAGAGLRLSGNDGRLKGHIPIETSRDMRTTVSHICTHSPIDEVRSLGGPQPLATDLVQLDEKVKAVLLDGRAVLLVVPAEVASGEVHWRTCSKQQLRMY